MVEAEAHAEQDKHAARAADTRNAAGVCGILVDKPPEGERREATPKTSRLRFRAMLTRLKKALEGDDDDTVKSALQKLQASQTRLGEALHASRTGRLTQTPLRPPRR